VTSGAGDCYRQNTGLAMGLELVRTIIMWWRETSSLPTCQQLFVPRWKRDLEYQQCEIPGMGCGGAHLLLRAQAASSYSSQSSEVVEGQGEKEEHEGASWSPLLISF